jgi:hypothetical protein
MSVTRRCQWENLITAVVVLDRGSGGGKRIEWVLWVVTTVKGITAPRTVRTADIEAVALIRNHIAVPASTGQKRRKKNMVPWWTITNQQLGVDVDRGDQGQKK